MTGLPMPPDAYWANVPWQAGLGFSLLAIFIVIVIGPWMVQRARNRPSAMLSREQSFQADQRGLEVARAAHMADVKESERQARAELAQERADRAAERAEMAEDIQNGWDRGRGMESRAHWYRHELVGAVMQFNVLFGHFRGAVDAVKAAMLLPQGEKRVQAVRAVTDRAEVMINNTVPLPAPPQVPALQDVERTPPS